MKRFMFTTALTLLFCVSHIEADQGSASGSMVTLKKTEGRSIGFGVGGYFMPQKFIFNDFVGTGAPPTDPWNLDFRSPDLMYHAGSPIISLYARQYTPHLLCLPTFWSAEFNYLTDLKKNVVSTVYAFNNLAGGQVINQYGYVYREKWYARFMMGVQLWDWNVIDLWAQGGVHVTNFNFNAFTVSNGTNIRHWEYANNYGFAPSLGLEARSSHHGFFTNKHVVTDFIIGWTANYRNLMQLLRTNDNMVNRKNQFVLTNNWSHEINLKVMFRF